MKVLLSLEHKTLFNTRLLIYFVFFLALSIPVRLMVIFLNFTLIEKYIIKKNYKKPMTHGWSPDQPLKVNLLPLDDISFIIKKVTHYAPWRVMCLEQALLVAIYLNFYKIPYSFYLGVTNSTTTNLAAHAWLISRENVITGGEFPGEFSIIYHFQK